VLARLLVPGPAPVQELRILRCGCRVQLALPAQAYTGMYKPHIGPCDLLEVAALQCTNGKSYEMTTM
jgi:hypothetical protein